MAGDLAPVGRVAAGFVPALAVGFEHELRGSPAGSRTFALVGTGTAAITASALKTSPRAVAGAITGIGGTNEDRFRSDTDPPDAPPSHAPG